MCAYVCVYTCMYDCVHVWVAFSRVQFCQGSSIFSPIAMFNCWGVLKCAMFNYVRFWCVQCSTAEGFWHMLCARVSQVYRLCSEAQSTTPGSVARFSHVKTESVPKPSFMPLYNLEAGAPQGAFLICQFGIWGWDGDWAGGIVCSWGVGEGLFCGKVLVHFYVLRDAVSNCLRSICK